MVHMDSTLHVGPIVYVSIKQIFKLQRRLQSELGFLSSLFRHTFSIIAQGFKEKSNDVALGHPTADTFFQP